MDYLKKINFDVSHYANNKKDYKRYKINCSRIYLWKYYNFTLYKIFN